MLIESLGAHHRFCYNKRSPLFFSRFGIFFILLLVAGTICYDVDLSDANDPPVMVSQLPDILYPEREIITLIKIVEDTIGIPFICTEFSLDRAPPA
jgi:hypothetical protein